MFIDFISFPINSYIIFLEKEENKEILFFSNHFTVISKYITGLHVNYFDRQGTSLLELFSVFHISLREKP